MSLIYLYDKIANLYANNINQKVSMLRYSTEYKPKYDLNMLRNLLFLAEYYLIQEYNGQFVCDKDFLKLKNKINEL